MPGRRTISVRAATYARLLAHAHQNGRTVSDLVEQQIAALFGEPWPPPTVARPSSGAPMRVTRPRDIPTKLSPKHRAGYREPPSRPRPLDIPGGTSDPARSGRNAPSSGRLEKRAPIGNVRTF
jgi:hypothetical protein